MSYAKNKIKKPIAAYLKRKVRVNAKIKSQFPEARLIVDKSNLYMKAQIIDINGNVLLSATDKAVAGKTKSEKSLNLGVEIAKKAQEKGIKKVTFDRNGYLYHGRVKALAD